MSLKYVGETALQENIVKTKEHVESVRATLDAAKQDKIELATMPQASEDNLGLVVIYTGSTTSTYTHGYMYECVSDGETPATYSWEQLTSDVKIDNTTIVKDAYTGELSAALATTHSLGIVKGGTGTMIGDYGEVNVYQRLQEDYVSNPGSRVSVPYYDSKFRLNKEDNGNYKKGGIYELQINAVTPVGTENPSEEGWYEYTGIYGDNSEYELTEDTTVDSEKTYYTIAWEIVSANSQEFNTDDFEIENNVVSLDVTQRSFTGTQADWDALTTEEKKTYGTVNITDDGDGSLEYYSTTETKTNKVWIDGKPIYRRVLICTSTTELSAESSWKDIAGWSVENENIARYISINKSGLAYSSRVDHQIVTNMKLQFYCLVSRLNITIGDPLIIEYTKTTD